MTTTFTEILAEPAVRPFLPFFFTLAIVYGLLEITDIFDNKAVNLIISVVFAFFAAGYSPFVAFFFNHFHLLLWVFIGLFFLAFFRKALTSGGETNQTEKMMIIGVIFLLALAFGTFGLQYFTGTEIPVIGYWNLVTLIGLVLVLFLFYNAYKMNEKE